jgi:hypothetical protein
MPYFTSNKLLKSGTRLRRGTPEGSRMDAEKLADEVRKEKFPSRPSRLKSVFVAPDFEAARKWANTFKTRYIYKVKTSGKSFKTDGTYWTEIAFKTYEGKLDMARSWAESYWEGTSSGGFLPELLVKSATIEQLVWEKGKGFVDADGEQVKELEASYMVPERNIVAEELMLAAHEVQSGLIL